MMKKTLYKKDSKGEVRVWSIYPNESVTGFITESGMMKAGAKTTVHDPVFCQPKNVGKVNETTVAEQVILEIQSRHDKKLRVDHFEKLEDVDKEHPTFLPMLAHSYSPDIDFSGIENVVCQPKFDGIRAIVRKEGVFTREGEPIKTCDHIHDEIVRLGVFDQFPDIKIDGELYNHELKEDFEEICSLVSREKIDPERQGLVKERIKYYVYDLYQNDGDGYHERAAQLRKLLLGHSASIELVTGIVVEVSPILEDTLNLLMDNYIRDGYEGMMVRIPNVGYEKAKRSKSLLKYKRMIDDEFEVTGIEEGKGAWKGRAKSIHLVTKEGVEFKAGIRGNFEYTKGILDNKDLYIGAQATVIYQGMTTHGKPRFGVVKKFWTQEQQKM